MFLVFSQPSSVGVLTILSPCNLPVLPFVFVRSDQPFAWSGLPIISDAATARRSTIDATTQRQRKLSWS